MPTNYKLLKESDPKAYRKAMDRQAAASKAYKMRQILKNPDYLKDCREKYKHGRSYTKQALCAAKHRAKVKGLDFDLEVKDIVIPETCPVLGIPLSKRKGEHPIENSPALDRVDNTKGYTKENVRVISYKANRYKSDMCIKDVQNLLHYMVTSPTYLENTK